MNILVTGGAGFICSHIAEAYGAAGHTVAILDNFSTGKRQNIPAGVQVYEGSILDASFLSRVFAEFKPEVVNHHAAQVSVIISVREPVLDAQLNVLGTVTVLQAAKEAGVKKIIYAASGGTMYGTPSTLPCPEEAPADPHSFYALSKETGEYYVDLFCELYGMKATVLRYGNVFGPRQDPAGEAGVCAIFTGKMIEGLPVQIFGDGSQLRDYVFVKDVAAANLAALEKGEGEAFNIATGIGTSVLEVFAALKEATGYTLDPIMSPARPGELQEIYLDIRKAAAGLSWKPAGTFRQAIAETVAWYRQTAS